MNIIILDKYRSNYRIKISKNYQDYKFKKEDIYIVDYKFLNKYNLQAWNKLLKSKNNNNTPSDKSFE